jgi:hypothetical protein
MDGTMLSKPLLSPILHNDALTRGLGDMEARVLVEWLVEQAERAGDRASDEPEAHAAVARLCRRARSIGRFVYLWCQRGDRGAAHQLAAAEHFQWPLPTAALDPCDLMHGILSWETDQAGSGDEWRVVNK